MLATIKHTTQAFLAGVFATILVIGCCHIRLDFRVDPAALEMSQNERIAQQLETVMPRHK
jgi:hypothetical protein